MARPYRPSSLSALFRRAPTESERDGSPPTLEEGETGHRSEPLMSSLWAGVEVEEEEGLVGPQMFSTVEDIVSGGSRRALVEASTADNLRNGRTNVYYGVHTNTLSLVYHLVLLGVCRSSNVLEE